MVSNKGDCKHRALTADPLAFKICEVWICQHVGHVHQCFLEGRSTYYAPTVWWKRSAVQVLLVGSFRQIIRHLLERVALEEREAAVFGFTEFARNPNDRIKHRL